MSMFFITLFSTLIAIELFIQLPTADQLLKIKGTLVKASTIIQSKHISDHWKEKILPQYSLDILKMTIQLLAIFLISLAPFFILFLLYEQASIEAVLLSPSYTLTVLAYLSIRYYAGKIIQR